jgi:predicted AlkP superfamily phosphohydrolase/phosphomutase
MDQAIGQRLGWLDADTTLFLVSDHGFQHVDSWFHVNRWLAETGWLQFSGGQSSLARLGLTRAGIQSLVRRLDAFGLRRHVGRFTRAAIANKLGDTLAQPVDWTRTVAYSGSRTSEGIYINLQGREPQGIVAPAEYESVRERIMAALAAATDARTGEGAVSAVYRREDVQSGPFLPGMPDIFFSLDDKPYLTSDSTTAMRAFEPMSKHDVQGRHHSLGILALLGPHVVPGLELQGANIVDVAPTLLYAMDLPIPTDMDGRVLEEAFDDDFRRTHPVRREEPGASRARTAQADPVYTDEEEAEMQRRLQGLGYLS